MPGYTIKVRTEVALSKKDLDRLEDVVYDELVDKMGAPTTEKPAEFIDGKFVRVGGVTDVQATYE